jgi:hypothetical protein
MDAHHRVPEQSLARLQGPAARITEAFVYHNVQHAEYKSFLQQVPGRG